MAQRRRLELSQPTIDNAPTVCREGEPPTLVWRRIQNDARRATGVRDLSLNSHTTIFAGVIAIMPTWRFPSGPVEAAIAAGIRPALTAR